MKIDRLIGIITILLQQEKATAPELAERFEVSRRTINRDIEDICKAGIPLVTTQGYGGGISIADGYKIDKMLFTEDELQTVLTGLKGIDTVSETSYLAKLSEKLFCKDSRIIAEDIIVIDLASHYQKALTEKIETIKKAIRSKRYITFMYYSNKGESRRTVEPYRLVFQWSSWYLLGYCVEREDFRLFKLNRFGELDVLTDQFSGRDLKTEQFDFGSFLEVGSFHLNAIFSESEKHRLIDEYGIDCYSVNPKGGLAFEWNFASYENMREWVFSFGDRVIILEPTSLYEDRIRQAESILSQERDG